MGRFMLAATLAIIPSFMAGCAGKQGPVGPTGDANVNIVTFSFSASSLSIISGDTRVYDYSRFTPELDSSIVDSGAILLYIRSSSVAWEQLPISDPTWPISVNFGFVPDYLTIDVRTATGDAKTQFIQFYRGDTDYQARLVLIPSTNPLAKEQSTLRRLDYRDLQKLLASTGGLQDR